MMAQVRISSKGQILIPKALRMRHCLMPGHIVDVIDLAFKHAATGVRLNDLRGSESILIAGSQQ